MKSWMKYIYMSLVLLMASCSDGVADGDCSAGGEGDLSFDLEIEGSKVESGMDAETFANYMKSSVLKIYDGEKLIRRYAPATECPEYLSLVAGNYKATLSVGSGDLYTTDDKNLSFYGEQSFTVKAGGTTSVELKCKMLNTKISAIFDDSLDDNLEAGYILTVVVGDEVTDDMLADTYTKKLSFTSESSGYLLADGGNVAWRFEGVIKGVDGVVGEKLSTGGDVVTNAVAGEGYELTFEYDKYLKFTGSVVVDESTEDKDDHFSFQVQPKIDCDFAESDVQLIEGNYVFGLSSSLYELADVDVTIGTTTYSPLDSSGESVNTTSSITYEAVAGSKKKGTLTISSELFDNIAAGEHSITINVTDMEAGNVKRLLKVAQPGIIGVESVDLWNNTATVKFCSVESDKPVLKYGEGSVANTTVNGCSKISGTTYCYSANIIPTWKGTKNSAGLTIYDAEGGIWAGKSYCYSLTDGVSLYSGNFTTRGVQSIPNGNMNSSSLPCFSQESSNSGDWASGNNSWSKSLCSYTSDYGTGGCAVLASYLVNAVIFKKFAAGNLVFGQFLLDGTNGKVSFGQKYVWESRPKSLNVEYRATVGSANFTVNGVAHTKDRARVYMAIVDWSARAVVTAGTDAATGLWDPSSQTTVPGSGKIIAYGSKYIDNSTSGSDMNDLEIPIYYYDTTIKPNGNYTLVISCASSAYGDYMVGSTDSRLWVDNFEFGY